MIMDDKQRSSTTGQLYDWFGPLNSLIWGREKRLDHSVGYHFLLFLPMDGGKNLCGKTANEGEGSKGEREYG